MHESNNDEKWKNDDAGSEKSDVVIAEILHKYEELNQKYAELLKENALLTATEPVVLQTAPDETQLIIVSLLMRLYDLNMALLSVQAPKIADDIFDHHAKGGHYNPEIFIPNYREAE